MRIHTKDVSVAWQISVMVMLSAIIVLMPDVIAVQDSDTTARNVLCPAATWWGGHIGKGIATVAITVIGIGALLGKISWGMVMVVSVGFAILVGAAGIINAIAPRLSC